MARIRVLLSGWRRHPQFDDIVASAYLGMWRALQHAEAGREPTGLALHGAWFGAQKFLSSHACVTCRTTCRDNERPELISLSDWQTLHSQDGAIRTPVEPDFAPRLIERIAATEELAKMPP